MTRSLAVLAVCAALVCGPASAGPADPRAAASDRVFPGAHHCMCRAMGRAYEVGERICLGEGANARLAECVVDINVMNWRMTREPCPRA